MHKNFKLVDAHVIDMLVSHFYKPFEYLILFYILHIQVTQIFKHEMNIVNREDSKYINLSPIKWWKA